MCYVCPARVLLPPAVQRLEHIVSVHIVSVERVRGYAGDKRAERQRRVLGSAAFTQSAKVLMVAARDCGYRRRQVMGCAQIVLSAKSYSLAMNQ